MQILHRLGRFLNCLSWKKICSPAVNTKSWPQSTHFSTLSSNSMGSPFSPKSIRYRMNPAKLPPPKASPVPVCKAEQRSAERSPKNIRMSPSDDACVMRQASMSAGDVTTEYGSLRGFLRGNPGRLSGRRPGAAPATPTWAALVCSGSWNRTKAAAAALLVSSRLWFWYRQHIRTIYMREMARTRLGQCAAGLAGGFP